MVCKAEPSKSGRHGFTARRRSLSPADKRHHIGLWMFRRSSSAVATSRLGHRAPLRRRLPCRGLWLLHTPLAGDLAVRKVKPAEVCACDPVVLSWRLFDVPACRARRAIGASLRSQVFRPIFRLHATRQSEAPRRRNSLPSSPFRRARVSIASWSARPPSEYVGPPFAQFHYA